MKISQSFGWKKIFQKRERNKEFSSLYLCKLVWNFFSLRGNWKAEIGKQKTLNWFIWIHNCEAKRWMRMKPCEGSRDWNNEIPLPSKNSKNFSNLMFKSVPSLKRNWLLNRFWFNNKLRITFWNSSRDF